ncbi:hypothetical protein Tco_0942508 [Tanacetum coccineum]
MYHNLNQLQWQLERDNLHSYYPKTCLGVLRTPFKESFDSKEVNASDFQNKCWQKHFKYYMRCEPETYRRNLLRYLDELDKLIDEKLLKYGELRMKEREDQAIKEIEKRLKKREIQQQESLSTDGATLEACLVDEGIALDDNLVTKESTIDSTTSSKQQNKNSRSGNENISSDNESITPRVLGSFTTSLNSLFIFSLVRVCF